MKHSGAPDIGDLVRFPVAIGVEGLHHPWSGAVGLVVETRGIEILVLRGSESRWMRRDAPEVISESR